MQDNIYLKFAGKKALRSKYIPKIPLSAEREYYRLVDDYLGILKNIIEDEIKSIKKAYKPNRDKKVRMDSETDMDIALNNVFNSMQNKILSKTEKFGLRHRLENIANINRKLTIKEWKKCCKSTLGIDIREDYYLGDFYQEKLNEWVENNVDLIKKVPKNNLDKMRQIIYNGYNKGITTTSLTKMISNAYGMSKRHARLIARDQTAKLNGAIQQAQQQDAGIEQYVWSTSHDDRVRKSHKELNNVKCNWNEAPLNSDGRQCHPGEDFQCRCVARPIFNQDIKLPVEDEEIIPQKTKETSATFIDYGDLPLLRKSGMSEDEYKEFLNYLNTCESDDVRKAFKTTVPELKNIILKKNGGCFRPHYDELEFSYPNKSYDLDKYSTLAHELGHNMDKHISQKHLSFNEIDRINDITYETTFVYKKCCLSDEFLSAVRKDKERLKKIYKLADTMKDIKESATSSGVQDALDGFFGTQAGGIYSWGHGNRYYNRKWTSIGKVIGTEKRKKMKDIYKELGLDAGSLKKAQGICRDYETSSEIWANISSGVICKGKELDYIKRYLPNSYESYLKILKGVEQ